MLTLTRQGLLLSLSATVIPSQGSSDVPIAVVNDINTYVGYTLEPRVGYYLNGIYKSTVCTFNTSAKNFSVPAEAFKQIGIIDITLALIDNTNANHVETCQAVHATVNKAPLGTVILPDQTTWQEYVNSYMNQLFDTDYKPQFDQIQQDLENLVTEAQQQQQTAEQQQTQIDNAISVMGEYQIVSNDPVQIQFKQGDGTYGPTVDLGDGLASKSMVNAGYYQSIGSQYSGAASDYGIEVEEIVGAYVQDGTPTPDAPIEPQFVQIENFYTSGENLFDNQNPLSDGNGTGTPTETGVSVTGFYYCYYRLTVKPNNDYYLSYTYNGEFNQVLVKNKFSNEGGINLEQFLSSSGGTFNSGNNNQIIILFYCSNGSSSKTGIYSNIMLNIGTTAQPYTPFVGYTQTPVSLSLMALPNGVADTWKDGTLTHNVASVTFDGSSDEGWVYVSSGNYAYIKIANGATIYDASATNISCDRLNVLTSSTPITGSTDTIRYGSSSPNDNYVYIGLNDTITSLETLRTWLSQNPITVWYQLATPTTEQLAIPTLTSFYPYTNAWCDSVVQPQQITWNVLTGKSSILDGNGNLIQQGYMTPQDNLLTNSDFASGIINQQGQTVYDPVNQWTLSIGRWIYFGQMQVFVQENQLRLYATSNNTGSSYFKQMIYNLRNGNCIAYVHVVSLSGMAKVTLDNGVDIVLKVGDNFVTTEVTDNSKQLQINLDGKGVDLVIDQIKFEYGEIFTGMPVWNEALELQKCLRFYEIKSIVGLAIGGTFQQFLQSTQANYYFPTQGFVTKNKTPTITVLSISSNEGPVSNLTATAQGATTNSLSSLVTNNQCDRPFLVFELAIDANDYQ